MTVKLGHFYSNFGYESVTAPDNFFYSHNLAIIYGEPRTETGLLADKKLGNFYVQAGVTRGWDDWNDNNNDLSFLGGMGWADDEGRSSLAFNVQSGPERTEPPESSDVRNVFSFVFQQKLGDRFQYVAQYDYGEEDRDDLFLPPATWQALEQYLFYTLTEHWKAGVRFGVVPRPRRHAHRQRLAPRRLLRFDGRTELDAQLSRGRAAGAPLRLGRQPGRYALRRFHAIVPIAARLRCGNKVLDVFGRGRLLPTRMGFGHFQ